MRFSKPFHLFVVGLFLFQTMLPINLLSATPTTKSLPEKTDSQDIPPSSLPLETVLLAELSGEMNAPLQRLHQRYPEQIALWQTLQTSLQDSDPRKPVLAQKAGTTATLISAVVGYSEHFDRAHQEIVSRIKENKDAPETEIDALLGRLYPLLQLQEKIATYELLAQTHFLDIHLLTRTINANSKQREILAEIEEFEAYRTQQIKQFLTVREEFENVRKGCAFLNRATEGTQLGPLKQNIADYRELATLFAARHHQNSSKSERDLFARLGLIASDRNRELQAVLSVLSEGREGVSWPLLFHLGPDRNQTHPAGQVFSPYRVLSVLRDMRTSFTELADILKQRNRLLVDSDFLHGDDMLWLTVQIELENLRLTRLAEVIDLTGKQVPQEDTDAYQQNMIHWEEFGLLKEDILSVEAVILNELSAYRDSEALVGDESWRQVLSLLHRQNRWRLSWSAIAASFEQVVDDFKTFQARMIEEELDAIETLRSDIKGIQARSSEMESPIAHFFTLVDQVLAEQYEATRVNRDLKTQVQQQDEVDPLFSHFFGIRSERFWHDFKHMGIALWDHEYLTGNLARTRAHLLALNNAGQDGNRQALVVLQLAQQIGLIDRIDYDGTSWTVFLRSATDSMLLTGGGGKAPPELRSAAFDRQMPRHATVRLLLQSLFCVVPSAHAGAYEQFTGWSGNVFNQMKKNWVNYAVTGVVMVGALAAAPVVAAAGATAATVTAVTAVATTTALGAKAAFYAQASADLAIGTSRQVVNQMDFTGNEYATKKNFNTAIDAMETTYN
ncbi:MAG: hypothetical protein IH612_18440, partial [Desulfofustis sp.]|nr:hypothetical protein [Desulfofustis sp.]